MELQFQKAKGVAMKVFWTKVYSLSSKPMEEKIQSILLLFKLSLEAVNLFRRLCIFLQL
mgnify:CR=1 FL=1